MSKTIGVGFIGAGANTKLRHLPGFAEIPGVRLVTVANRSEESSRKVAESFGVERISPDWQSVVADPEVDAICIGTWPYMHAPISIAALEAGKHVLTEARMASTLEEAREMESTSRKHPDLVAQIVPSPFTLDQDSTVKNYLRTGELGNIREAFVEHAFGACVDPEAPLTWRQDPRYSGVNMLTMGIYHEVIDRWFVEPVDVLAAEGKIFTRERIHWESGDRVPVELPDCLHIIGRLMTGALINYHFSAVEAGPGKNEIRLVGSRGTLRLDVGKGELYISRAGEAEKLVSIPDSEKRGWQVEADFIDSIRNGTPVQLTSFDSGLRYMEFTNAVFSRIRGKQSLLEKK